MTPQIIKQTKVLLPSDSNIPTNFSRLQATTANLPAIGADLEDWTDDDQPTAAWELDDEHTKNLIIEKRKELRAQRQQKQKMSSNLGKNQPILLAERIDTRKS